MFIKYKFINKYSTREEILIFNYHYRFPQLWIQKTVVFFIHVPGDWLKVIHRNVFIITEMLWISNTLYGQQTRRAKIENFYLNLRTSINLIIWLMDWLICFLNHLIVCRYGIISINALLISWGIIWLIVECRGNT